MDSSSRWGAGWRRSSRCAHGDCVEVTRFDGGVAMRDSKSPETGTLRFNDQQWTSFIDSVRTGTLDDLRRI